MNTYASKNLESFLDFIRESKSLYKQAEMNEQEANDETQDILHKIELENMKYHKLAQNAKILKEIRKKRRDAKDTMTQLQPVNDWSETNSHIIKDLERLLGAARKAEKNTENRIYTCRTDTPTERTTTK